MHSTACKAVQTSSSRPNVGPEPTVLVTPGARRSPAYGYRAETILKWGFSVLHSTKTFFHIIYIAARVLPTRASLSQALLISAF